MVDIKGEPDPQMDRAEGEEERERHWPDEDDEPALPTTASGTIPAVIVGGTTGTMPIAAGAVPAPDEPSQQTPDEGTDAGDPDEWRVPRD